MGLGALEEVSYVVFALCRVLIHFALLAGSSSLTQMLRPLVALTLQCHTSGHRLGFDSGLQVRSEQALQKQWHGRAHDGSEDRFPCRSIHSGY